MTISNWLQAAHKTLKNSGITSAQLDSMLLLEEVTGLNRAHLLAHPEREITQNEERTLQDVLNRRKAREPIAYITKHIEFYGRQFYVDQNVLIPRPESEAFIELANTVSNQCKSLVDVGCGSGILGITLKLQHPSLTVTLTDIDEKALNVARKNATTLHAEVNCLVQDMLDPAPKTVDLIVANLPYVPNQLTLEPELGFEPKIALFSEEKGMHHYQLFWGQARYSQAKFIITESLISQHDTMVAFAKTAGYNLVSTQLLVQLFKKV